MKNIFTTLCFLLVASFAFAQGSISGIILDETGSAMIGANVVAEGTTMGTITDIDGSFTLEVPDGTERILVSYIGYADQTINIAGKSNLSIQMKPGSILDEVVVTALGLSRDEKALGYAVQEVGSETIRDAGTVSAIDALAGSAAGVNVNASSGAAGASSRIVLRGQTSFNGDNQALIVVDGIRMNNSENSSERSLGGVANSNRAMDLNPNDIESVSILKGGAATALYGLEGARGVILITTKKGKAEDGIKVEYGTNLTFSKATNITGLNTKFTQGSGGEWSGPGPSFFPNAVSWGLEIDENTHWVNDPENPYRWDVNGEVRSVTPEEISALRADGMTVTPFKAYNNVDDFFQTGTTWQNNLAISGGTGNTTYRLSLGNSDETGIAPNNEFDRFNAGLKIDSKALNDKLTLGFGGNFANIEGQRIQQGSNVSGVMLGLLRTPPSFDNANGFDNPADEPGAYQFPDNSQRNYRSGGGYDNPYWVVNNTLFNDVTNRFFGNIRVSYEFTNWLKLGATVGTDFYTDNRVQRFEIGSRSQPGGQVIEDTYDYRHTDQYYTLTGQGQVSDDFTIGYQAGVNLYDEKQKNTYVQGDGLNFFGFAELGNTSAIQSQIDNSDEKTAGIYGTIDVGYQNFLYLTLTGRNDWTSTLINPNVEFDGGDISFFYPSVSLGVNFSEKIDIPGLSYGKIRASYAETGGGAPGSYSTSTPFIQPIANGGTINDVNDGWTNGVGFPFGGVSGFLQNGVAGNPSLIPSTTTNIEVGADLRFLQNKIGLDLSFYTQDSEDQIIAINIPASTGFQRATVNSGELSTKGFEIVLNLSPVKTRDFSWNTTFNFSKWKTEVESLPNNVPTQYLDGFTGSAINNIAPIREDSNDDGVIDNNDRIVEKFEYGQIFGQPFQRVNDVDAAGNDIFNAEAPYNRDGEMVIENDPTSANYGFPRVDPSSRVLGNPNPDFLLGITNTFRYKDFSLSFLFDIREGGDIWNGTKGALTFFGASELTENRGTVTVFPGVSGNTGQANDVAVELTQDWYTGNGGGFGSVSEHFIEDGSFGRLRYVTLGYDFGSVLSNIGVDNLRLSFTGRNLLLITDYTGFDPELSLVGSSSNGQGLDYFQLPNTRSFSVGLNAKF